MKNVWLAQPTNQLSESVFLPYSIGVLAAYAWNSDIIKKEYALKEFLFLKQPIDTVLHEMENPFLVGFSCYMWNIEYNLQLARSIKEKWPSCIIVFGGQQIPPDTSYLEEYPFVDILLLGEGEQSFSGILESMALGEPLDKVHGVVFRKDGTIVITEKQYAKDLSGFPSPYLEGFFDHIIHGKKYEGFKFDGLIETTRGCPYGCLYCAYNATPVRQFPMEKVKGELEWLSQNQIEYCICADGNFGMMARDEEIADFVIELKKRTGFPKKFETTSDKNKADRSFRIYKNFHEMQMDRGVALDVQSLTPEVLQNVNRKNMSVEAFSAQLRQYRDAGINTYTDLILGLPGESFESFCKSLFNVIEAGQHYCLAVYCCLLLPNAPMNSPAMIKKYGIKTIRSCLRQTHSRLTETQMYDSRSEIVVETNTMSKNDWAKMNKIACIVQALHCFGLLRFVAIYLRQALSVSYYDFYKRVFEFITEQNPFLGGIVENVNAAVPGYLAKKNDLFFVDRRFGDINLPFDEGMYLCFSAEGERFYNAMRPCLREFFTDAELFEDLYNYQKNIMNLPGAKTHKQSFVYDWYSYFKNIYAPLPHIPVLNNNTLLFHTDSYDDLVLYAREIVWYGKRHERTIISDLSYIQ